MKIKDFRAHCQNVFLTFLSGFSEIESLKTWNTEHKRNQKIFFLSTKITSVFFHEIDEAATFLVFICSLNSSETSSGTTAINQKVLVCSQLSSASWWPMAKMEPIKMIENDTLVFLLFLQPVRNAEESTNNFLH